MTELNTSNVGVKSVAVPGLLSIFIAALLWLFVAPELNPVVIASLSILAVICIALNWSSVAKLPEQTATTLIVIGCSLELTTLFSERMLFIIIMGGVILWFANTFFKADKPLLAWLTLTMGLMTAPFTELHLERNLWTLTSCMFGMLHLIQAGPLKALSLKRIRLAVGSWILLTTLTLMSAFWSAYPYVSFRFTGILIFNLMVFIQLCESFYNKNNRTSLITMTLSFAGVYSLASFVACFQRVSGLGWAYATGFRIYVFERHPNYAIFFLLMSLPLWLLTAKSKTRSSRVFSITGLLAALMYLVFLSYSRQGYILLAILLLYLPFLYQRIPGKRLLSGTVAIGITAFSAAFLASAPLRNRLISTFDLSGSLRFNAWKVFVDLIREQPILGYGMDTARFIYPKALGFIRPGETPTRQFLFEAHNAYIDILYGVGIVGLAVFLVFMASCTIANPVKRNFEGRVAFLMGVILWIDLVFNFRLHAQDTSIWLIFFLAYTAVVHGRKKVGLPNRQSLVHPALAYALVLMAILFCAPPWLGKYWIAQAQQQLRFQNWPMIYRSFSKAAMIEPLNAHPQYYLGLCYANMNQPNAALNAFQQSVDLCPNYPFYRFHLAVALIDQNRMTDARNHLETGATLDPYDVDARVHFNLSILQWRMGDQNQARKNFWTAILLNPDYVNDPYWNHNSILKEQLMDDLLNFSGIYYSSGRFALDNLRFLPNIANAMYTAGYYDEAYRLRILSAFNYPFHKDSLHDTILYLLEQEKYHIAKDLTYYALNYHTNCPHLFNYLGLIYLKMDNMTMARFCAENSLGFWSEYAVDNFAAFQILKEVGRRTNDSALFKRYSRPVEYLADGRHATQTSDLVIHIGLDSYLVRAVEIISDQTE